MSLLSISGFWRNDREDGLGVMFRPFDPRDPSGLNEIAIAIEEIKQSLRES